MSEETADQASEVSEAPTVLVVAAATKTAVDELIETMKEQTSALSLLADSFKAFSEDQAVGQKERRRITKLQGVLVVLVIAVCALLGLTIAEQFIGHHTLSILERQTSPAAQQANSQVLSTVVSEVETQVALCDASNLRRQSEANHKELLTPLIKGCPDILALTGQTVLPSLPGVSPSTTVSGD